MNKQKVRSRILDCLFMLVLAFLFALSYQLFIVKNQFAPSGFSGIATMVEYKTGFSVGYLTLILNVPLCIFAYFCITKEFAVKTFIFSVAYSLFLLVLQSLELSAFQYDAQGVDTIFPALIAGSVSGFVYGIAFRRNSSTGGTDVIAKYVSKRDTQLTFFWINFVAFITLLYVFFFILTTSLFYIK